MSKKILLICICLFFIALTVLLIVFYDSRTVEVPETAVREPIERAPVVGVETVVSEPTDIEVPTREEEPEPEEYIPQPAQLVPRIAQLREEYDNPDIVGFIEITGTNISYPVAQTGNNVFYLYHDLHWNASSAGAVFLDYENDLYALADDNTIIYGHNMRNGSKFHNIRHFHGEDFFRTHTYILLDTPYQETVWDIFSFFHTTTAFDYLTTNFHNRDAFYAFILELQGMSHHTTDIVLSPEDQILILSTCGVMGNDNRYVVVARLRR